MTGPSAFDLTGKRIVVTGANTGIGQGIAVSIARAGGNLLTIGRSSMDETASKVARYGVDFEAARIDLAKGKAAVQLFADLILNREVDGLVNNAGIIRRADAFDFTVGDWDDVLDLNLKSTFFLSQSFARNQVAKGKPGKIVNIASLLSFQGGIRVASYTASKHGVVGLTKLLANEWASLGINVNSIAPGYVVTNNTEALRADPERNEAILQRIPAGRWGQPDDIGDPVVFLLCRASDYIHGATLQVDGGWLAR